VLLATAARRRATPAARAAAAASLVGYWSAVYAAYRRESLARTAHERELLATATLEAFSLHYNERVPTIEEEFDIWGEYHQHRHEMRYDILAERVREHVPPGGRILDLGCGSVLVADRILDLDVRYVGIDFGGHHINYAAKKLADTPSRLRWSLARGDGEALPFTDATFDVVVFSEVIEHLMRPERAVWEIARVLKPGGVLVMTTNNASEVPLRSPLSHLFAWGEKAVGADHPSLISLRPWIWPERVDPTLLPADVGAVYLPHTHHIQGETRRLFAAAGLTTFAWSSFEFPPPQSATARWLDAKGEWGRQAVDLIEAVARRTPVLRRLGCHLLMEARKTGEPVAAAPPAGVWPGPFSNAA
jgi:ubiquinone/menaquinone biosynthesis C-methylase UbiE